MPQSGGTYVYIERVFALFGTISGIGLWASLILKSSFALIGFGWYLLAIANINLDIKIFINFIFNINFLSKYFRSKKGWESSNCNYCIKYFISNYLTNYRYFFLRISRK